MTAVTAAGNKMRLNWVMFFFGAAILAGYGILSSKVTSEKIEGLKQALTDTYATTLALEQQIGYGGLVHNLKNYILRGSDGYYIQGKRNAVNALALLDKLEENAASLQVAGELPETRKMLMAYGERLEAVKQLKQQDLEPAEIDQRINFDDKPALDEIDAYVRRVVKDVTQQLEVVENAGKRQNIVLGLVVMSALLGGVYMQRSVTHSQEITVLNNELTERNQRLSGMNMALQQFAGIASHDLKTPIRHIFHYCELLKEDADNPEQMRDYADQILTSGRRMQSLVESLLEYTKTAFSDPELEITDTDELVKDIIQDMRHEIGETHAVIDVKPLPYIYADPELMRRVFQNLIGNSIKYARDEVAPHIVIDAETRASEVEFSIADNGIGVAPEHADKIFEPMQRLHGKKSKYSGVGIGLALVKTIIEGHGGKVWLDASYRNGAQIKIILPRKRGE